MCACIHWPIHVRWYNRYALAGTLLCVHACLLIACMCALMCGCLFGSSRRPALAGCPQPSVFRAHRCASGRYHGLSRAIIRRRCLSISRNADQRYKRRFHVYAWPFGSVGVERHVGSSLAPPSWGCYWVQQRCSVPLVYRATGHLQCRPFGGGICESRLLGRRLIVGRALAWTLLCWRSRYPTSPL